MRNAKRAVSDEIKKIIIGKRLKDISAKVISIILDINHTNNV